MTAPSPIIQHLLHFLDHSPTPWHAVDQLFQHLLVHYFKELPENEPWTIQPEKRYIVQRNGSSFCAFVTPKKKPKKVKLFASHTDSPSFKLKPQPDIQKEGLALFGVEVYGSPLISSWLNRDLGIAGQIVYLDHQNKLKKEIIRIDDYPLTIPQLAIHLDREVNERGTLLNKQDHLNVLVGINDPSESSSTVFENFLKTKIDFQKILGHDLFLFPLEKSQVIGYPPSFIASYRIDSLASVHAITTAFVHDLEPLEDELKMILFWNHEEIGSESQQGASSNFFQQIIERIIFHFNGNREELFCLLNQSLCVSVDLAHAVHPNYPEKHDSQHRPCLGQGVVIKFNAQQRYATNGETAAPIYLAAHQSNLKLQEFVSRNDIPCGTTIGPIHASKTGMPTVDIGCGQLTMHGSRELLSCQDHLDLCTLLGKIL